VSRVSTDVKHAILAAIYFDAEDGLCSLKDGIKATLRARVTDAGGGKFLTGATANGHSYQWLVPGSGGEIGPTDMLELSAELWRRYNEAVIRLGGGQPSDHNIYREMADKMAAVDGYVMDYTALRTGPTEVED
jgi:hypothetical protein